MKTFTVVLAVSLIFTSTLFAQSKNQRYNPFSGTVVISVEGGTTFENTDYAGTRIDYIGRASLEYFFAAKVQSGFGLRLFYSAGFLSGEDNNLDPKQFRTNISTFGGGVVFILSIKDKYFPYLFAGISNLSFEPKGEGGVPLENNRNGVYSKNEINYNAELGIRFPVTPNLSLNLNGGVQISPNDWLDDKAIGTGNDMFFTAMAGVSYSFLTEFDSDDDGVVDSKDMCDDTPKGVKVDEFGCPLDTDGDGVPDYKDECPSTPRNVKVDAKGCALDTDKDGVPDYMDICPDTPAGIKVDDLGCPYDLDADGVPDYLDKCPDTPYEVEVDARGCPLDSDLDGVPDYLDQCPGTLPGMQVDEKGCEITPKAPEPVFEDIAPNEKIVLSGEATFEFNSAVIKKTAYPELDKLLAVMKKYPLSRWRIEGHTDNVGSEAGNLKISKLRAESVLNYFVSRGIPKIRFEVVGLGSKFPIADNKTKEGRAKNRRVVIIRLN